MKIERQLVGTGEVCAPLDALADEASEEFANVLMSMLDSPNPRVVVAISTSIGSL